VAVAAQGVRPAFSRHGASGKQAAQDFDDCQLEAVHTVAQAAVIERHGRHQFALDVYRALWHRSGSVAKSQNE
jgi:hypothetical protein